MLCDVRQAPRCMLWSATRYATWRCVSWIIAGVNRRIVVRFSVLSEWHSASVSIVDLVIREDHDKALSETSKAVSERPPDWKNRLIVKPTGG
jgi:hypothetical protein